MEIDRSFGYFKTQSESQNIDPNLTSPGWGCSLKDYP